MGRQHKVNWEKLDQGIWVKQDIEIASLLGVSRERVRQMRPSEVVSINYRHRRGTTSLQRIMAMDVTGKTMKEIAIAAGCGLGYARMVVGRAKKAYRKLPHGNARYDWKLLPANWQELTDKEMASMVGASSPAVVTQWRIRHGMRKK